MHLGRKTKLAAATGLAAAAGATFFVWYLLIRDEGELRFLVTGESPPPVSLAAALEALAPSAAVAHDQDALGGTWRIPQDGASFVGYRVKETLATFGANLAVGRTTAIDGSLHFDGRAITSVEITADLTRLVSDHARRDEQLREQSLETNVYPTALFVLTSPIEVTTVPPDGEPVRQGVRGKLTLHGVTKEIEVDVEAALANGTLLVVGSTEVALEDFEIERPVSFTVLSIEDHGTMEFQLWFRKQPQ